MNLLITEKKALNERVEKMREENQNLISMQMKEKLDF